MYKIKKSIFCFSFIFILSVFLPTAVYANDNIIECPDIKVFIDGKASVFSDVVIAKGGSTLLPLRALLASLGVENDESHIIWNNIDKTVTVVKDSKKIVLKQDSKTAYVNDTPITLDVAPIGYSGNGRTYIPVRFVAQTLGKKVVWDDITKSIYIRDEIEYNRVKELLDSSIVKMDALKRYKVQVESEGKTIYKDNSFKGSKTDEYLLIDKNLKIIYYSSETKNNNLSNVPNLEKSEGYFVNNYLFNHNLLSDSWDRSAFKQHYFESILSSNSFGSKVHLNPRNATYAGLLLEDDVLNNQYILKGPVCHCPKTEEDNMKMWYPNMVNRHDDMEIHISKNTGYITGFTTSISQDDISEGTDSTISKMNFSDFNGNFSIDIPDYIKNQLK